MKNFLPLLLFAVFLACSEKTQETQTSAYIPGLVITDSLVIDRLTKPYLIDVREDRSEYLFFDFQTDEFLRIAASGEILAIANRSEDGKDSYREDYFYTADYLRNDQILILTSTAGYYYDLEFKLIKDVKFDFFLYSQQAGGSKVAEVFGEKMFAFSYYKSEVEEAFSENGTWAN